MAGSVVTLRFAKGIEDSRVLLYGVPSRGEY